METSPPTDAGKLPPNALAYGRQSKRRRWIAMVMVIIVAVAWPVGKFAAPYFKQFEYLRMQRACMTFTVPADQLAYAGGIDVANPSQYLRSTATSSDLPGWWSPGWCFTPPAASRFWPGTYTVLGTTHRRVGDGVLFSHERVSPDGQRGWILVRFQEIAPRGNGLRDIFVDATFYKPATFTPGTQITAGGMDTVRIHSAKPDVPLAVYFGQPDPHDASKFTIRVVCEGREETVIGEVYTDKNGRPSVKLYPREEPSFHIMAIDF